MLRNLVLALAMAMTVGGLALIALGVPAIQLPIFGALLLVGTLCERVVYKRLEAAPARADRFQPTGERFFDDATGAPVTVWTDPKTGERKYVRD